MQLTKIEYKNKEIICSIWKSKKWSVQEGLLLMMR